jgi:hypothetical protein
MLDEVVGDRQAAGGPGQRGEEASVVNRDIADRAGGQVGLD